MKIFIFGGSGSGKTTLARQLALEYKTPLLELDSVAFDNSQKGFGRKTSDEERADILQEFMKNQSYIIEGNYFNWLGSVFDDVDVIYILSSNIFIRTWRIIKRFVLCKLGISSERNDTFKSVFELVLWNFSYRKKELSYILQLYKLYLSKVIAYNKKL